MHVIEMPLTTEPIYLADWLEISALLREEGISSYEDLKGCLRLNDLGSSEVAYGAAAFEPLDFAARGLADIGAGGLGLGEESVEETLGPLDESPNMAADRHLEETADAVFSELEYRSEAAGRGYPFDVGERILSLRGEWGDYVPYVFCLMLSYLGTIEKVNHPTNVRTLFEEVSTDAARGFLGCNANAYRFGHPRTGTTPSNFVQALDELTSRMREGKPKSEPGGSPKDGGLDVVAWRPFPDKAPGQLVLFGNCATSADMDELRRTKCKELNVAAFEGRWFSDQPVSPVVPAFFIPHRFDTASWNWKELTREKRHVVFERCRIALCARRNPSLWQQQADWVETTLTGIA